MKKEIQFLKHMTNPKVYFQCQLPVYIKQYNLKIEGIQSEAKWKYLINLNPRWPPLSVHKF